MGDFVAAEAKQIAKPSHLLKVLGEFFMEETRGQVRIGGYDRAFALLGKDDAFALEFEVGAFDRDDAYAQGHGELANGGDFFSGRPFSNGDALFDLLHDLQIHWAAVRL
jgi:hypothetical protein